MATLSLESIVVIHTITTMGMTGVIWFVQVVHYPLFAAVPGAAFVDYEALHTRRTVWVVATPMVVEALSACALAINPPADLPPVVAVSGVGLVGIIWLSTNVFQVPCHRRLSRGFSPSVHQRLVMTNWIRTVAWTLRCALASWIALAV